MIDIFSIKKLIVVIILNSLLATYSNAQQQKNENVDETNFVTKTRTELLNELSLRSAQVAKEHAQEEHERYKREYENALSLFDQSIISKKELDEALSNYTQAEQQLKQAQIQLEKTKLSFLDNATHITIMEAKKYYDSEGRRMLDLVVKNTSNLTQAESSLGLIEDDPNVPSAWQGRKQIQALLNIDNIIVSIVNDPACIGKPYEQIIPTLPYGQEVKLTFALLTDVQEAGVKLQYLDQNITEKIFLEKESLQNIPTIIASQFSQEGQLGTDIRYNLDLEMLVTSDKNFSLAVTNMPPQISCSFIDSKSGARITGVRFTEEVSKHDLALKVSIPQKLEVDIIDKTINFQIWTITTKQLEEINKLKQEYIAGIIPSEKLNNIKAGRVDLALIPKGTGKLEILINNLYTEIKPQEEVNIKVELDNAGTLDLFNIIPEVSPPLNWTAQINPKSIAKLAPGDKEMVKICLKPGADVGVGEYEAQIEARGQSGSEVVEALDKRLKIRIYAKTHIATTLVLVLALVALIGAIVIFSVKLSRK